MIQESPSLWTKKVLIPRLNSLGHLPPALNAAQLFQENGYPVLAVEFGANIDASQNYLEAGILREKLRLRWPQWLPKKVRPLGYFLGMAVYLLLRCFVERPRFVLACGMQEHCLALLLNKVLGIPFVAYVLEIYEPEELDRWNRIFYSGLGRSLRDASLVLVPEAGRANLLKERFPSAAPFVVVYNCPRRQHEMRPVSLKKIYDLPKDAKVMGYLGGIGPHNALEEAIGALIFVPKLHFILWGWGDDTYVKELQRRARRLGVERRLIFAGELKREDKWAYLSACDVSYCIYAPNLLRLKHAATASNKLMESLAAGVPVLTSNHPDFAEILSRHDVGVAVSDFTSGAIAEGLQRLLEDPSACARKSLRGKDLHARSYHYEFQFAPVLTAARILSL